MTLKLQILSAFRRGASHFCGFTMWETRAFFVKLVRICARTIVSPFQNEFDKPKWIYCHQNFSSLNIFMSMKLQILPAFRRGVAHFYSFIMWDTRAFFVKLVRNWNVPISSNFAIIWWNRDISISNLLHKKWSGVSHGKAIKMCYTSPESWKNLQFQRHQNDYAMLSISGNMSI